MGILSKLSEKFLGGNILYYPGCLTKFVSNDLEKNYQEILRRIGIDFIQLKDLEMCCGSPAYNAGYKKDFEDLIGRNLAVFNEHGVSKIITNCPACYKVFAIDYPENSKEWNIKTEHITLTIWNAIKNSKIKLKRNFSEEITYHDPCHLGRHVADSKGISHVSEPKALPHSKIYEEPRGILRSLGFSVREMANNRREALCCGGGGGLKSNQPEISNRIAEMRLNQAGELNVNKMITSCPLCYLHLKENSKSLEIFELSEVLIKCLRD